MAGTSSIEWTDVTWNPVAGCTVMSAGCTNCYAMRMAARLQAMGHSSYAGTTRKSGKRHVWTGKTNLVPSVLEQPYKWRKPRHVFVNSMSDLFAEGVPFDYVARVWSVMEEIDRHTYQVLTKRPDRMAKFLETRKKRVPSNIWIGTSVEDIRVVDRIAELSRCPAEIRFISFEPLIGSVGNVDLSKVAWAIVGGESGPNSRAMDRSWVDEIHTQCRKQDVSFFFKQWGGTNKKAAGRILDGRTWDEMPRRDVRSYDEGRTAA